MELFNAFLRSTYYKRVATLQNRRERADDELKKLYEYRQALIEKNITGVFSDEVFKEQNKLVEDKIHAVQIAKEGDLLTKYNLEAITEFIKEKLVDLEKTYRESDLEQTRVFMFSIFPSGMRWNYPGCSKHEISPFWSSIQAFETDPDSIGRPEGTLAKRLYAFFNEEPIFPVEKLEILS